MSFEKILHYVQVKTEKKAFSVAHNREEIVNCDPLSEKVKLLRIIPAEKSQTVNIEVETNGVNKIVSTDKEEGYFDELIDKFVYVSGVKADNKNEKYEKWLLCCCYDVTSRESCLDKSDLFTEEEKREIQYSIEMFSPEIQKDLCEKQIKLAGKYIDDSENTEKALYKEVEELDALYNVQKRIIPSEFREVYETARYRLGKKGSNSEKRNYQKQMQEVLDFDWANNCEFKEIDVEAVKKKIDELHIGHRKHLDTIYTELKASNISKKPPKTMSFIGRYGAGCNLLAEEIAKSLGRGHSIINLAGTRMEDTAYLNGTSKIYENARPGLIYERLRDAGYRGVVVIQDFDLYDAVIRNALIPLIERSSFQDKFVEVEFDLSNVFVIVTCNTIKDIPMYLRSSMTEIYFRDLNEAEISEMINKILVPKYCKEFGLEFNNDIPVIACRKLIYKLSNMDMNKLDSAIRSIAVKTVTKGGKAFPDYSKKEIDEFDFENEDYEKVRREYAVEITAVEKKFFTCYDEYPECVQKKVIENLNTIYYSSDRNMKEYAINATHYLSNIFDEKIQPFEIGSIVKELNNTHFIPNDFGIRVERALLSKILEGNTKKMTVLGFRGSAGTGKSTNAKIIADALHRKCIKVNVGGSGGSEIIKGTIKTVHNASPGMLIRELSKSGCGSYSSVIILDECDKATVEFYNALYEFLDPDEEYLYDQYLECWIPKNNFIVILTFNDISGIPLPIRDRMEIIEYDNYSVKDKKYIISEYVLAKLKAKYGIETLEIEAEALDIYTNDYDFSPGLRNVERDFEYVLMQNARENLGKLKDNIVISKKNIFDTLGEPRSIGIDYVIPNSLGRCGMAQALAVTSNGIGVSTAVETVVNPYQEKNIVVTGLLEGSCLESISIACCLASRYLMKELPKLHIHTTDAIRKDGPSAGLSITMSVLSCMLEKPLPNVAFTGSVDLYGNVGAVGGVFDKCICAERIGVEKVYMPTVCYQTIKDRKQLERLNIRIVPIETVAEVVESVWGIRMEV